MKIEAKKHKWICLHKIRLLKAISKAWEKHLCNSSLIPSCLARQDTLEVIARAWPWGMPGKGWACFGRQVPVPAQVWTLPGTAEWGKGVPRAWLIFCPGFWASTSAGHEALSSSLLSHTPSWPLALGWFHLLHGNYFSSNPLLKDWWYLLKNWWYLYVYIYLYRAWYSRPLFKCCHKHD